ncbi:tetratricopeptide repeat protein [Marinobacter lacisalsi]|uniref:Tetratricopeptide repeat protein n=1 Tax=Marinobacter lacisalsi TaxID=475979 RepID=A0ABV8QKT7_9GAMM
MQGIRAILSASLFLLPAVVCHAQGPSAGEGTLLLEKGVAAFQAGDAGQARHYLLKARESGVDSTALTYNLGVANYQLARYDAAAREFQSLLDTPHRDLARYNLGLVALATENPADARDLFLTLSTESQNDKIRRLSQRQLERLTAPGTPAEARPTGLVMLGGGYDSNVDQLPDSASSGSADVYYDGLLVLGSDFDAFSTNSGTWSWNGLAYHQRFPGESESNLSLLEGGLGGKARLSAADLRATVFTRHWWLHSDRVESYYGVRTTARRNDCGALSRCYAQLEVAAVSGGPEFPEYDGWQYKLETGVQQNQWGGVLGVELGLELADRENIREADYASSVSPFRQRIELSWRKAVTGDLTLTGKTAFRRSDYQGDYQWQTTSGAVSEEREDERWSASVLVDWQVTADWFVSSEWLYESNQSSLDGYDYDRYNLWLGVGKTF